MTSPALASQQIRDRGRIELPFSYNYAARLLNRSRNHVRLVCEGSRQSHALVAKLDELLKAHESGIGKN